MMVSDRRGGVWTSPNSKLMTMDYCNEVVQCERMETKAVSLTSAAPWLCLHATNCLWWRRKERKRLSDRLLLPHSPGVFPFSKHTRTTRGQRAQLNGAIIWYAVCCDKVESFPLRNSTFYKCMSLFISFHLISSFVQSLTVKYSWNNISDQADVAFLESRAEII